MPTPTEFDIQRALCIWLDRPGVLMPDVVYWHTPNGGSRDAREGKRFKQTGVKPGIHDLFFLHRGRLFGLELKGPGGTLSASQLDMHPRLIRAGLAGSAVCDNLVAAKCCLSTWGLTINSPS